MLTMIPQVRAISIIVGPRWNKIADMTKLIPRVPLSIIRSVIKANQTRSKRKDMIEAASLTRQVKVKIQFMKVRKCISRSSLLHSNKYTSSKKIDNNIP